MSFDCNIRTRRADLRLEAGGHGAPLLGPDMWLMEIKAARSIPIWLCRLLSENKIFPVSFSQYGVEYRQMLMNRNTRKIFDFVPERAERPAAAVVNALNVG